MKKRILFVDDEPAVLEGLRNRLRKQRERWEMSFVEGGEAALRHMASTPVDVLVTDMRMPGMDGATLMERVRASHPGVVRIVLSGHSELEAALRAVPVAHQFLSKPCEPTVLEAVIDRACNLQQLVGDEVVRSLVGRIGHLPSLPRTYARLRALLVDEKATVQQATAIIVQDPSICAKLLQIVNSAFFRLSRRITRLEEATSYLGLEALQRVVLAAELFSTKLPRAIPGLSLEDLQLHSLVTASLASRLVPPGPQQDAAFLGGVLHDVGLLVLATSLPDHLEGALKARRHATEPLHEAEIRRFGVSHAEIGGYLLGIWGLPYPIVEAVANHHAPSRVKSDGLDLVAAVHLANFLAHDLAGTSVALDPALMQRLGAAAQLDDWRARFRPEVERIATEWSRPLS